MNDMLIIDTGLHWVAVSIYVLATIANTYGIIFEKYRFEKASYFIAAAGLIMHGIAIVYRWWAIGHGPYIARYEVLSSIAWITLFIFFISIRIFPKLLPASIIVFPSVFLLVALSLFQNPEVKKLPPTLKSIWLVLHVIFYKIAFGTLVIALSFSFFYIFKKKGRGKWLQRLPAIEDIDVYAYRFAGFGFVFWAIAMLAGSIWAYQSWGRFWAWDPVETWSLITWLLFGIYLHLRRFFVWKGVRAAYLFMLCFLSSVVSYFFISLIESSVHSAYFK